VRIRTLRTQQRANKSMPMWLFLPCLKTFGFPACKGETTNKYLNEVWHLALQLRWGVNSYAR
jgi:hypothetical protein